MSEPTNNKHRRGFASMTVEARTAIARLGGSSIAAEDRAFFKDRDLAAAAGRKGGLASVAAKKKCP